MLWRYLPGKTPEEAFTSGFTTKGGTISELASKIQISVEELTSTIQRFSFNAMATLGTDTDFHRGFSIYNRYFGDPTCKTNLNLGPLLQAPFSAIQVWPGDL